MKRYEDIQELLSAVGQNIAALEADYEKAKRNHDYSVLQRPLVKTALEHLRSTLEYCAQDIYETKIGGSKSPYFPYGKNQNEFDGSLAKNLPSLQRLSPKTYNLILGLQPFKSGQSWLIELCKHANLNKHRGLTTPERSNSPSNTTHLGGFVTTGGGCVMTISNCLFNGVEVGVDKPLVLSSERAVSEIQAEVGLNIKVVREYDWVEFRFKDTDVDVLKLLKTAHINIHHFVEELKAALT